MQGEGHTYTLRHLHTHTHIFSRYSGISSHSFGRSYCNVHVAFVTRLESPAKPSYFEKSWCVGQFRGIPKTTNLGKRSSSLSRGKVPQCKGLLNSFNGGIHNSIQSFWTCSNPSKIECYVISLWCWLKFPYWCATWVWRFDNVEILYEAKIQWSKRSYFKMRFHTIRSSRYNT